MKKNIFLIIFNIALIVGILNIFHVIIGFAKTPSGQVYLATGHYYLDYFEYYLQPVSQGARGSWLYERFDLERPVKTIFGAWQNVMIGKSGAFFGLSAVASYWISIVIFSIIFCLLIYLAITKLLAKESFLKQFLAYIIALFAAPFFKIAVISGKIKFFTFHFWNDKAVIYDRFGGVPYHISSSILMLLVLIIVGDSLEKLEKVSKKRLFLNTTIVITILVFLLTFSPESFFLLVASIGFLFAGLTIYYFLKKRKFLPRLIFFLGIPLIIVIPIGFWVKNYLVNYLYAGISQMETTWQINPPFIDVLLTTGPIIILALFGSIKFFRQITPLKLIFTIFVTVSYGVFFSPLNRYLGTTNTRFLTSINYVFFGALAVSGIKKTKLLLVITTILFLLFLPANIEGLKTKLNDSNLFSPITYLPKGIIDGFKQLEATGETKVVLTTPAQFLGTIVPIYTGKRVYISRPGQSNYYQKAYLADQFYLGLMPEKEAKYFLLKNNIGYVILTSIEAYPKKNVSKYNFLREIYKNEDIVIFKLVLI